MNEFRPNNTINYAEERCGVGVSIQENPNMGYDREPKKMSKPVKIWMTVILSLLGAYILYSVLVNPITQMRIQMFFVHSGTVSVSADSFGFYDGETVYFDQDRLYIPSTKEYFIASNSFVYKYEQNWLGKWEKKSVSFSSNDIKIPATVYKYSGNYTRDGLFTWKLKSKVNSGDLTDVKCSKLFGQYVITGYLKGTTVPCKVTITIRPSIFVNVDAPWEK